MQGVIKNRNGIFERVFPISVEAANRMLHTGYKHPSSFGKWDPVLVSDVVDCVTDCPSPLKDFSACARTACSSTPFFLISVISNEFASENMHKLFNDVVRCFRFCLPKY